MRRELGKGKMAELNIVLYEPEIPANTGNIGRTCVATGTRLHLIEPLGFRLDEKSIRRAGMDYWKDLDVVTYVNWQDFCGKNRMRSSIWRRQKRAMSIPRSATSRTAILFLEKRAQGSLEEILKEHPDTSVRIPMIGETRSLNLSNSVAIVLYEALRQNGFDHMKTQGELHRLRWED